MIINTHYSKHLFNLFAMTEISILLLPFFFLFFSGPIYNFFIPSTPCFFLSVINFAFLVIYQRLLFALGSVCISFFKLGDIDELVRMPTIITYNKIQ